ncbi:hypothetical protein C8F01DRAFT_1257650 [Mycena amicta]|nr:hypothetical protein C8F01DRAFT_1257650 [Mycena amicta]
MSNTLSTYLELLELASTTPGRPTPFVSAFPKANTILVVETSLISAGHQLFEDFAIHFREEEELLLWWIPFDDRVMASFTISNSTRECLRDWSPTAELVLRSLQASLLHDKAQRELELIITAFTASTLGRSPAQELSLCDASGCVVLGAILYRCVTKRCNRVFVPGSACININHR